MTPSILWKHRRKYVFKSKAIFTLRHKKNCLSIRIKWGENYIE